MKRTTLVLEPALFRQLKEEAVRAGKSLRDCVNEILRLGLRAKQLDARSPLAKLELPAYCMGAPRLDAADREAVYELLDRPEP